MGFFSSEYVEHVASSATNLVSNTPDTGKNSILHSILRGTDLTADLVTNYANGIGIKMRHMRNYALNHYELGLPDGKVTSGRVYDYKLKAILDVIEGGSVSIISNTINSGSANNFAFEFMSINRGWNYTDNIVTAPSFTPTGVVTFLSASIGVGTITINYLDDATPVSETVSMSGVDSDSMFIQASYAIAGTTKYWNYKISTGVYPSLTPISITEPSSPYLPIIPFRSNNVDMSADKTTPLYISSERTLRMVGMEFSKVCETIHENPDIADIDHAFFYAGVSLRSEEQNSIDYMHNHFRNLEVQSQVKKSAHTTWLGLSNDKGTPPVNIVDITDSTLHIEISYLYIDTSIKTGVVGDLRVSNRTFNVRPRVKVSALYPDPEGSGDAQRAAYAYETSDVTFTRQIDDTTYMETVVYGLYLVNHIYNANGLTVDTSIGTSNNDTNVFLIPINIHIATQMGIQKNDKLFYDSVYLITTSYERTKLKWYQTSWFSAIVQIVAIIITIYSLGSMAELVFAAATLGDAALVLMTRILISYAVKIAIDFALDVIGIEAAIILAVAASVYSLGSSGGEIAGLSGLPFADEIMQVVNLMIAEITEDIGEMMQDVSKEFEEFITTQTDIQKEMDALDKELSATTLLDYESVIRLRPNVDLTESPSQFYYRAIHAGNVGVHALDAIQVYVEEKLKLPDITTIGNY